MWNKLCLFAVFAALVVLGVMTGPGLSGNASEDAGYEYQQDLSRLLGIWRADQIILGHLDANGNFVEDPFYRPIKGASYSTPLFELLSPPRNATPGEEFYEFRSGFLIRGTFDESGRFTPKTGTKVISFKDYRWVKGALRIYNLPGYFVEKNPAQGRRDIPTGSNPP